MTGTTPLAYARWRGTALGAVTERLERAAVLDLAGPLAGRDVLDVGCGDGTYALAAARAGARVTGVDRLVAAIEAARRNAVDAGASLELHVADARALPFPAGRFDVVLGVTVLCFVPDRPAAVAEMARVLRPGGVLVLGELGRWSAWAAWRRLRAWTGSTTWRAARFWTPAELRGCCARPGSCPEACEERPITRHSAARRGCWSESTRSWAAPPVSVPPSSRSRAASPRHERGRSPGAPLTAAAGPDSLLN